MPNLFKDSGGSEADRMSEARRILYDMGLLQHMEMMQPHERTFVENQKLKFESYHERTLVSVKSLFWLRDLKDKYV